VAVSISIPSFHIGAFVTRSIRAAETTLGTGASTSALGSGGPELGGIPSVLNLT
jgi:hypothetical protein